MSSIGFKVHLVAVFGGLMLAGAAALMIGDNAAKAQENEKLKQPDNVVCNDSTESRNPEPGTQVVECARPGMTHKFK